MSPEERREKIIAFISDAALDFTVYDRKDCETLSMADIATAIEGGLGFDDLGEAFGRACAEHMGYEYGSPEAAPVETIGKVSVERDAWCALALALARRPTLPGERRHHEVETAMDALLRIGLDPRTGTTVIR